MLGGSQLLFSWLSRSETVPTHFALVCKISDFGMLTTLECLVEIFVFMISGYFESILRMGAVKASLTAKEFLRIYIWILIFDPFWSCLHTYDSLRTPASNPYPEVQVSPSVFDFSLALRYLDLSNLAAPYLIWLSLVASLTILAFLLKFRFLTEICVCFPLCPFVV